MYAFYLTNISRISVNKYTIYHLILFGFSMKVNIFAIQRLHARRAELVDALDSKSNVL